MAEAVTEYRLMENGVDLMAEARRIEDACQRFPRGSWKVLVRYERPVFQVDRLSSPQFHAGTCYGEILLTSGRHVIEVARGSEWEVALAMGDPIIHVDRLPSGTLGAALRALADAIDEGLLDNGPRGAIGPQGIEARWYVEQMRMHHAASLPVTEPMRFV